MHDFARLLVLPMLACVLMATGAQAQSLSPTLCPHAEILCLRKLGYNFETCGTLTGPGGLSQEFPLCGASDAYACVPCWFGSAEETRSYCVAKYGPSCSTFRQLNENWKGRWEDIGPPDLTPLQQLIEGWFQP
jgi:hypothetical protein